VHRLIGDTALSMFAPDAQTQAKLRRWSPSGRPIEIAESNIEQALLAQVDHLDMSLERSSNVDHDGDTPPTRNGDDTTPDMHRPLWGGLAGSIGSMDDDGESKKRRTLQIEETRTRLQHHMNKLEQFTEEDNTEEKLEVQKQIDFYSSNLKSLRDTAAERKEDRSEMSSLDSSRCSHKSFKVHAAKRAEQLNELQKSINGLLKAQGKEMLPNVQGDDDDSAISHDTLHLQLVSLQESVNMSSTHAEGMALQPSPRHSQGSQPDGSADLTAGPGASRDPVDQAQTRLRPTGRTCGPIGC